jgi:GNAT superfamily N-acetyltransferase
MLTRVRDCTGAAFLVPATERSPRCRPCLPARDDRRPCHGAVSGRKRFQQPGDSGHPQVEVLTTVLVTPGRNLCVAVLDERIVGTADGLLVANLPRATRLHLIVERMIVTGAAHRNGAGRARLDHLVEIARRPDKVQLLSDRARTESHRFNGSAGSTPSAVRFRRYLSDSVQDHGG